MPKVSIIIPAYNRLNLLVEAVVSCFVQTTDSIEVLVVDDGSETDLRPALYLAASPYSQKAVLRHVRQPRAGAAAARNRGLREATGEFVQFLDSDDLLHPRKLATQAALLQQEPSLDMVFCLDEWFASCIGDMGLLWNAPDGTPEIDRFPWNDVVWSCNSPLWRRRALERVGQWDTRLTCWQDWEFHMRALSKEIRYAHVPEVLQFIRKHDGERISTGLDGLKREASKLQACRLAGQHLRAQKLLTGYRGDGLATFLLRSAHELVRLNDVAQARTALWTAARRAGSPRIKAAGMVMLAASLVAQARKKSQASALNRAQELVERRAKLPVQKDWWQSIKTVRTDEPVKLIRAIAALRERTGELHS